MPKLNRDQLNAWYENFSQVLKNEVHIDVTCKEDLARVKNYKILSWDMDESIIEIDAHYAFMTGEGSNYDNPAPEDRRSKYEWTINNQDPNMTEERIQQLYDMVQEGTLMVRGHKDHSDQARQVRMDENGKIFLSPTVAEYVPNDSPLEVPPEKRLPPEPEYVPQVEAMEMPVKPELPPLPNNLEPGFFSRLGYYLGLNTDYAKLMRYQAAANALPEKMAAYDRSMEAYRENQAQVAARENYESAQRALSAHPDVKFLTLISAYRESFLNENAAQLTMEELSLTGYINRKHYETDQGKVDLFLDETAQKLDLHAPKVLKAHMSEAFQAYPQWMEQGVYNNCKDQAPAPYDLPRKPANPNATDLKDLARIACFAALADPAVSGKEPFPKFTQEQTAQLRYTHILNDVFTYGRKNSAVYLAYLEPAREKGIQALNDYANGNVQPLADLLAQSLRQTNREAASVSGTSHHAMNTLYYSSQLFKTLEAHPDLMAAANLTPEEIAESRANAKYLEMLRQGLSSKMAIVEHATGAKPMTDDQLKDAIVDVLFAAVVDSSTKAEIDTWATNRSMDPSYKELADQNTALAGTMQLEVDLIQAQAANDPKAADIEKQLAEMRAQSEEVSRKLNLWDFQRPANQMREQLLDEAWVAQSRQILAQSPVIEQVMNLEPKALMEVLYSNETITATFGKDLLPAKEGHGLILENESALNNDPDDPQKEKINLIP